MPPLSGCRIQGQTGEEDRRRVELDAGEQKQFEVPIRLGSQLPAKAIEVLMTMNVMQGDKEVLLKHDDASVMRTLRLNVAEDRNITATVLDRDPERQAFWRWPRTELTTVMRWQSDRASMRHFHDKPFCSRMNRCPKTLLIGALFLR